MGTPSVVIRAAGGGKKAPVRFEAPADRRSRCSRLEFHERGTDRRLAQVAVERSQRQSAALRHLQIRRIVSRQAMLPGQVEYGRPLRGGSRGTDANWSA